MGDARVPDPLPEAVLAALRAVQDRHARLAQQAGGLLSAAEAAALTGSSPDAVWARWRRREVLAVRWHGTWRFPAIQFAADGTTPDDLAAAIRAMPANGAWVVLQFLMTPQEELGCRTPLEAMRADGAWRPQLHRLLARMEDEQLP